MSSLRPELGYSSLFSPANDNPDQHRKYATLAVKERLSHVYMHGAKIIRARTGISNHHLDIGTHDGFAIPLMAVDYTKDITHEGFPIPPWHKGFAKTITSIDINHDILSIARNNPDITPLIEMGYVNLVQMDANNLSFAPNSFDSATIVEVLGAGYVGNGIEGIKSMIQVVHETLKPGGILVMTCRSAKATSSMSGYGLLMEDGYPIHTPELLFLHDLFTKVDWYGQVNFKNIRKKIGKGMTQVVMQSPPIIVFDEPNGNQRFGYHPNTFIPKHLPSNSYDDITPFFMVAICQK